ncbi:MAG: YihY/virulence factor BrkB family protein, partial [Dermatophilaceae bacterium]
MFARFRASKPWRAWKRYGEARGNILAAGVGYFAFFSIFPAVALAFSVFGFVLRGHSELLASIADSLNANLPGFVKDAQHPEGLIPIEAPRAAALTITGVIAFVSLVLAGMGWLGAVREGIRAVFGVQGSAGNLITTKLRDLGVLFTLGLGIALSAVLTSVIGVAAGWIADRIGLSGQGWILVLAGFAVSVLADTGLMMLLLRVLSGVPVHSRDLVQGALLGGLGFSLLKLSASTLLPRVTSNPLFASIAIVIGLLFWLNLIARLTLISAAWAANDRDHARSGEHQVPAHGSEVVAQHVTSTSRADSLPTFGARSADRTTLAAGAVLGAAALVATRTLAHGIRSAVGFVRR